MRSSSKIKKILNTSPIYILLESIHTHTPHTHTHTHLPTSTGKARTNSCGSRPGNLAPAASVFVLLYQRILRQFCILVRHARIHAVHDREI